MTRFAVRLVVGYESHDEYITTDEWMFDVEDDDVFSLGTLEDLLMENIFEGEHDNADYYGGLLNEGDRGWLRIEEVIRIH